MTRESRVIAITSAAHFLTHMYVLIFPAVIMPLARDMGLSIADVFPVGFLMYFLYGALALPAGYAADRWSRIALLRISILGMSLASIAAGFSAGVGGFTVSLAMIGLFCGIYHPAGLGLIAHEIEKQGGAHGINGVFGNLGIAAAPFITGVCLMLGDWRTVYFAASALGFIGLALTFVFSVKETHKGEAAHGVAENDNTEYWKYFAILCAAMTVAGLVYRANMTTLPSYFELRAGGLLAYIKPLARAGVGADAGSGASALLVSTLFLFSMMGQFVGGRIADRIDLRRAYLLFHACAIPFVAAMALLYGTPLYFAAAGLVFFSLGMQPIENSLVAKFVPRRWLSTGYGIKFTFTFGVGSLAVYQVAYIEKLRGLDWVYPALTAQTILLVAIAASLIAASRSVERVANVAAPSAPGASS